MMKVRSGGQSRDGCRQPYQGVRHRGVDYSIHGHFLDPIVHAES